METSNYSHIAYSHKLHKKYPLYKFVIIILQDYLDYQKLNHILCCCNVVLHEYDGRKYFGGIFGIFTFAEVNCNYYVKDTA